MTTHSSVTAHEETLHETETTVIPISDALRLRAQTVINDIWIDPQWRTIICYAVEVDDPWLPDLVQRAEAGENIVDTFESLRTLETNEDDSTEDKIKALAEIICHVGEEAAAALFVLMGTLEGSSEPETLINTAKHVAFARCAELNLYGMVEAQMARLERELLGSNTLTS